MHPDETKTHQDPKTSAHRTRWRPAFRAGTGCVPAERFASETEICFVAFWSFIYLYGLRGCEPKIVVWSIWQHYSSAISQLGMSKVRKLPTCLAVLAECQMLYGLGKKPPCQGQRWSMAESMAFLGWYDVTLAGNHKFLAFPCTITPCRIMQAILLKI